MLDTNPVVAECHSSKTSARAECKRNFGKKQWLCAYSYSNSVLFGIGKADGKFI